MGILNWLFGKQDNGKIAEQARIIVALQHELDALRQQEEMNRGYRDEVNRLREAKGMVQFSKPSVEELERINQYIRQSRGGF